MGRPSSKPRTCGATTIDWPVSRSHRGSHRSPLDSSEWRASGCTTFHRGWTLHRASSNPTDIARPVMTVIYVADGARVTTPNSPAQDFDRQLWLGGVEPGGGVDGPDNPVAWSC